MALHLYTSNSIERLASIFGEKIKQKQSWRQVSQIVVQTEGVQKWLSQETATRNRIFANYQFSNPDSFIGQIQALSGNYSQRYFSAQHMKWKLFVYLNDAAFAERFPEVAGYCVEDDTKRIQLAGKVADLFEQYQVYRPQIIASWNKAEAAEGDADFAKQESWQRYLWQQLKTESDGKIDQSQLKKRLLDKMDSPDFQELLKAEYPSIHLFAIVVLSNHYWEIFEKLATIIDVSIYVSNPAEGERWYQEGFDADENDLLSSCKDLMVNLCHLLPMDKAESHFMKSQGGSLLSTIQGDIVTNSKEGIQSYAITQKDDSLKIASSYTPVREVEALYNHLLDAFENNPTLKGSEVSVRLVDVNLYAPLIKAVFDNAPKRIPYVIADQSFSEGDSLIKALDLFINLPHSNFKAENVLQLLDFRAVRQRFDITDVDLVRELVAGANIRFGIAGNIEDETYLYSWQHGLKKLVLGYAIKGSTSYTYDDTELFPCDAIEGNDALNIFKLKAFADTIFELYEQSKGKKSIQEWKDYLLNEVFSSLFEFSESYDDEVDYIYKKLENLSFITTDMDEEISFRVFQEGLINLLNSETLHSVYTSGLVTFSSMRSVRTMPYKHIAVLGLNSGDFPRQKKNLGFDLMALAPQANDRNTKSNDKQLFLDLILSAKEQLYLSYIGASIKDNSPIPPSLLIEELEDYIITGTNNKAWFKEVIEYKHPLHASSKLYFQGGKLFTYLGQSVDENQPELNANDEKEEPSINFEHINLNDLVSFYKDPFKWYYNKVLRIYYSDDAVLLPEEEPFELDNLQKWGLKNELVRLSEEDEASYVKRRKNDGAIQLANMAMAEMQIEQNAIEELKAAYAKHVSGEEGQKSVHLQFGDSVLSGKIQQIYDGTKVHYNVSGAGSQPKYLMDFYIKHLAYKAIDENASSVFISSTHLLSLSDDFISADEAREVLGKLIAVYKKGHEEITLFTSQSAFSLLEKINHSKKPVGQSEAINQCIKSMRDAYPSDYITKEASLGFFDDLLLDEEELSESRRQEVAQMKDTFMELSELLFTKLSTLIAIQ